jgi:hypothetical protein
MRINGAPCFTSCERDTKICPIRPSTRAAKSNVRDCSSPCTTNGSRRLRYQIDSPIIATNRIATLMTVGVGPRGRRFAGAFAIGF